MLQFLPLINFFREIFILEIIEGKFFRSFLHASIILTALHALINFESFTVAFSVDTIGVLPSCIKALRQILRLLLFYVL